VAAQDRLSLLRPAAVAAMEHTATRTVTPSSRKKMLRRIRPPGRQLVPDAVAGLDEAVPGGALVDLLPQLADEDVDGAVAMRRAPAPDLLQQLVAVEHTATVERQHVEQAKLGRGQLRALPVHVGLHLPRIDPQLLDLIARVLGVAPRLAEDLSRRPKVLDAVLDRHFFDRLPETAELEALTARRLMPPTLPIGS
jgi:hypothetical protein